MRSLSLTLLAFTILFCSTCASSATVATRTGTGAPTELTLDLKGTRTIHVDSSSDVRHTIKLEEILDSRCPATAKCIWAGELAARMTIERENLKTHEAGERQITLGQLTTPSVTILGASLELVGIDKSSITFRFKRAD